MNVLSRVKRRSLVLTAALVVLLVAMVVSTRFVTPEEAQALRPQVFEAKSYVAENFPKITQTLQEKGTDLGTLAPAVDADAAAAGKQYGIDVGSGKFAFPVTVTGTVASVDAGFLELTVDGVPADDTVRVPVANAVSGTPIRDATGFMTFSDFPGQTDFQNVANEIKIKVLVDVVGKLDPASLQGKQVTVVGAYSTGGPKNSFLVQPVSVQVAS
ncbi:DUF2291 family protein [Phycicoccus sonneratiae]|uniref:DUF2291 family protein n=1 Tax=Phycicoccus sonneratiae TaxID=2807628 RepID=A0ABS2CPH9_9MICO|nr:DUF2291 family protein [Phycicoccus sonneraticus]MBM6401802.1 DUF2291 family protein [Phycicoccus sonneraticus]